MALHELWPFQIPLVRDVRADLEIHPYGVVLASCPGSGKTTMGLSIAPDYLRQGKVVMVLTHGTNTLLTHWINDATEHHLSFTSWFEGSEPTSITFEDCDWAAEDLIFILPQNFRKIKALLAGREFGLLIIDEAHEFYFAEKLVNQILTLKPERQLMLTGTPSPFVASNQDPDQPYRPLHVAAGTDVWMAQAADGGKILSDPHFIIVRSAYNFRERAGLSGRLAPEDADPENADYSGTRDLKQDLVIDPEETKGSMTNFVDAMFLRLQQPLFRKNSNVANLLTRLPGLQKWAVKSKWTRTFTELKKTMIAAHDIRQANHLRLLLEAKGVSVLMSVSGDKKTGADPDSLNVELFKTDPQYTVLIVVRRGILGFNMPDLCNVVDFTCSRNINRIYQLYARALRRNQNNDEKFYFRIASNMDYQMDSLAVQAAVCLNNKDFITKFNGKNLNVQHIVRKKRDDTAEAREPRERPVGPGGDGTRVRYNALDNLLEDEILGLGIMSELALNADSKPWREVEVCRYSEAMKKIAGHIFNVEENIEKMKAWILAHPIKEAV